MGDVNNPPDSQITLVHSHRSPNNHVTGSAGCLGPGMSLLRHPGVYFRRKPAGAAFRADKLPLWTVSPSPCSQSDNLFSCNCNLDAACCYIVRLQCDVVATEPRFASKTLFHSTLKLYGATLYHAHDMYDNVTMVDMSDVQALCCQISCGKRHCIRVSS